MENGAFYFTKRETLIASQSRIGASISIYEMAENSATEIDEPKDWETVDLLLRRRLPFLIKTKKLKHLFVDIDGTLTDAGMYYNCEGEFLKRFNTRDGMGLRMLMESGISVAIATSEISGPGKARARKIKVDYYFEGIKDKAELLQSFALDRGLELECIGFIGDDLNDYAAMNLCGFCACPSDAVAKIKKMADYVCNAKGGQGAVRELCDILLESRNCIGTKIT